MYVMLNRSRCGRQPAMVVSPGHARTVGCATFGAGALAGEHRLRILGHLPFALWLYPTSATEYNLQPVFRTREERRGCCQRDFI